MNTEPPYNIRSWDELTEYERKRYLPLTPEEFEFLKNMTERQREWLSRFGG